MDTASAIPRVVPITHCGPGCADKQYVSLAILDLVGDYEGSKKKNVVNVWKEIPKAQFNLVISTWLGLDTAKHLEKNMNNRFYIYQ